MVAAFSGIAAVALVGVASAGFGLAWSQVRTLDALTSTHYGQLLIAKVSVVALVAALGAWNRVRLVPALDRAPTAAGTRLRRTVGFEAAALLGAVAVTGVLVQVTPARASIAAVFSETVPLGDGSVNIVIDPPRVGETSIHLYVLDAGGRPLEADALTVELSLPAADIGPLEREPFTAGPGHFQLDSSDLSIAGNWTITVDARLDRFDEASASIEVPIRS
jgi:copper transport protein